MTPRCGPVDVPPADLAPPAHSRRPAGPDAPAGSPLDSVQALLGVVPKRLALPLPRWLGPLAVCCTVAIVPWIVYLALTLPHRQRAVRYDVAWVGYDAAMCLVLASLAYCALRRKTATGPIAAVAATMLVVDAWFDIITTSDRDQFTLAIISAACAEIPLAIICGWVAINAERFRARAYQSLRLRWERAVEIVRSEAQARSPLTDQPDPLPPQ
jgi:hypothetical protein